MTVALMSMSLTTKGGVRKVFQEQFKSNSIENLFASNGIHYDQRAMLKVLTATAATLPAYNLANITSQ